MSETHASLELSRRRLLIFVAMALLLGWIGLELLLHALTLVGILPRNLTITPTPYSRDTTEYAFDAHGSPIFVNGERTYRQIGIPLQTRQLDEEGFHPMDRRRFGTEARRIGFFGDSYVEGLQVAEEETFPQVFEAILRKQGQDVACFNFGVGGTGTYHQYLRYLTVAEKVKLDDVILCFFPQNDVLNNHARLGKAFELPGVPYLTLRDGRFVEQPPAENVERINRRVGWMRRTVGLSFVGTGLYRTWRLLRTDGRQRKSGTWRRRADWLGVYGEPESLDWKEAWAITEEVLRRFDQAATEHGSRFRVLLVADSLQIADAELLDPETAANCDFEYPNRRLRAFCESERIRYLDSLPYFLERKAGLDYPYFSWEHDGHYSQLGHRTMAEFLAEEYARQK